MKARRPGLTVLGLLIILVVIGVAVTMLLRLRGRENAPPPIPAAAATDSLGAIAPAGAGNELTTRLAFLAPRDSTARAGDTLTVRLQATTESGTAVARATIDLAVTAGGGQLSAASAASGDNGEVEVRWALGAEPGVQTVSATVEGNASAAAMLTITAVARPAGAP